MVSASHVLDRVLVLEMVRVTEAAAIAASRWIGRGDNDAADAAAVEAMRAALNELPMAGTVVTQAAKEGQSVSELSRGFAFNADLVSVIRFLDIGTRSSTQLR